MSGAGSGLAGSGAGRCLCAAASGVQIRDHRRFDFRDLILQHQLPFFQAPQFQLVYTGVTGETVDDVVQIPVFDS